MNRFLRFLLAMLCAALLTACAPASVEETPAGSQQENTLDEALSSSELSSSEPSPSSDLPVREVLPDTSGFGIDFVAIAGTRSYRTFGVMPAGLLQWWDYQTDTFHEEQLPGEWVLHYAFQNELILEDPSNGTCYQMDWQGNLLDSFQCKEMIGRDSITWCPLPDFSGVLYQDFENESGARLYLWDRTTQQSQQIATDGYPYWGDIGKQYIFLFASADEYYLFDLGDRTTKAKFNAEEIGWTRGYSADEQYLLFDHGFCILEKGDFIPFTEYTDDPVEGKHAWIYQDTLCYLTPDGDWMRYSKINLSTGEHEDFRTEIPSEFQYLGVRVIDNLGKVIIRYRMDNGTGPGSVPVVQMEI